MCAKERETSTRGTGTFPVRQVADDIKKVVCCERDDAQSCATIGSDHHLQMLWHWPDRIKAQFTPDIDNEMNEREPEKKG